MMIRWWWFDDDDDGGGGDDDVDVDVDVVSNGQYSTSSQSFYHHHDGWCFSSFFNHGSNHQFYTTVGIWWISKRGSQ